MSPMEIERYGNLRFINFLDYPDAVPDARTIWLFRERLSETGKDKALWKEIWRNISNRGITVREGIIRMQLSSPQTQDTGGRRSLIWWTQSYLP